MEYKPHAELYANRELGFVNAKAMGMVWDPEVQGCAMVLVADKVPVDKGGHPEQVALVIENLEGKLMVTNECEASDFFANGGRITG